MKEMFTFNYALLKSVSSPNFQTNGFSGTKDHLSIFLYFTDNRSGHDIFGDCDSVSISIV